MWRRVPCEQQLNMGQSALSELVTQCAEEGVCIGMRLLVCPNVQKVHFFTRGAALLSKRESG